MADAYSTVAEMAGDEVFSERLRACAGIEGHEDPWTWVYERRYALCGAPGWAGAVDYWRLSNGERDGWQNLAEVVSDQQILAQVQTIAGGA